MIGLLLSTVAAMAAAAAAPRLDAIGRQQLPARGCAAFLWEAGGGDRARLVAMVVADPAMLRLAVDGAAIDLSPVAQQGPATLGLPAVADYRRGGLTATLTLSPVARADLRDGAAVPQATLRLARDGGDETVVPLAGLVGCRPSS